MTLARLDATLDIAGRRRTLSVGHGELVVVDGADAAAVVGAVTGIDPPPGRHRIHLDGRRLHGRSPARRVARGLGVVADAPVAADVDVLDHLAAQVGVPAATDLLADAPRLGGRGADPAGVLSGGERRVLAWLRCIAAGPRAVVLDRAGRGLDDVALAWAGSQVRRWRDAGVAILLRPGRAEERAWAG